MKLIAPRYVANTEQITSVTLRNDSDGDVTVMVNGIALLYLALDGLVHRYFQSGEKQETLEQIGFKMNGNKVEFE